ncbi:hypothetical protein RCOM_1122080 [Ricinus communis]|uniref:TIR domain-containing protein n=1 Tax=Ricinus communis TaxID=3988 RepID=B9SHJ1_RICCO|nr:hypothetical protein RCOM_1122080 [Ricinus communis]
MASSSFSSSTCQWKKYDVFISFRGKDIRDGFLSHLHEALRQSQINAFIDESIERGKEISSSLLKIIEESHVSVVIFTENYADSPWPDSKLIGEVVSQILEKLNNVISSYNCADGLVGNDSSVKAVKSLLCLESTDDVRFVGIRGMGEIEFLVGNRASYCSGSRVVITSRNKQLLRNMDAKIYEVKKLNYLEALHLFSSHAFKGNHLKKEYMGLSRMAVTYAGGIPLALKVFGSNLYGKSIEEWEGELEKLKATSDQKIQRMLRISFDGLDKKEKEVFLDIACFFKGGDKDAVTKILDSCGFFAKCGVSHLSDKSLITISSSNTLEMHDLLQQMGKDIVCEEKELGQRSRLWDPKDIHKGTRRTESISLDMSKIGNMELSSTAFVKMYNLRFLKCYVGFWGKNRVLLPDGLEYMPGELRFLYWDEFPMKSLPCKFRPENIVELQMKNSKLKQLWTENKVACSDFTDHLLNIYQDGLKVRTLCIPGNEIVRRMKYQNNNGSSLCFRLERHDLSRIAFCAVVASKVYPPPREFYIGCRVIFTDESGLIRVKSFNRFSRYGCSQYDIQSEHVYLWCDPDIEFDSDNCFTGASFEFYVYDDLDDNVMVIKCRVHPIFSLVNKRKRDQDDADEKHLEEKPSFKKLKEA